MQTRLSHSLPWLKVRGKGIVCAETGQAVLLCGVNRSGLEYSEPLPAEASAADGAVAFLEAAAIWEEDIRQIASWGANIIRLPINQHWALHGRRGHHAESYVTALDSVIEWAAGWGMYTLLDLQWLSADIVYGPIGSSNKVAPLPNLGSIALWTALAARYRDEPAVLFDIFTEPHTPISGDPNPLQGILEDGSTFPIESGCVTMREWQPWARQLVHAIRREHPRSLIFVSGIDWGYDLRGMPLTVSQSSTELFDNIVYSTHVYPQKGSPSPPIKRGWWIRRKPDWQASFGGLSEQVPVFAAEWGVSPGKEDDESELLWANHLMEQFDRLNMGWTAWSWHDRPHLLRDAGPPYRCTRYGEMVRQALSAQTLPRIQMPTATFS